MPEHPEAPDRIGVCTTIDVATGEEIREWRPDPQFTQDYEGVYLRSTPARIAAEQMLEALKEASTTFTGEGEYDSQQMAAIYNRIRAAIAAAQGEEDG